MVKDKVAGEAMSFKQTVRSIIVKKKLTQERVDEVETQVYILKIQNNVIKREGSSEQSQKTLLLAQFNLMNKITDLWFEKAFTFERW